MKIASVTTSVAFDARRRWMRYRRAGGPRTRIVSDFTIGADAFAASDVILT